MAKFVDIVDLDGSEPIYSTELSKTDLIKSLNWYSRNKDSKDSEKYILTYFKKKYGKDISYPVKDLSTTFGFLCRIINNGGSLPKENMVYFDNKIHDIINYKKKNSLKKVEETVIKKEKEVCYVDIILCLIDSSFDTFILSNYNDIPYTDFELVKKLNRNEYNKLIEFLSDNKMKYIDILESDDEEMIVCYTNKSTIKKIIRFYDTKIDEIKILYNDKLVNRKPRKKKKKSSEDLIKNLKYCKEFPKLNIISIDPKSIIGCNQLIVFNIKNNKIGMYMPKDGTLSIDKSKIVNFDIVKSYQKIIKMPLDLINQIKNTNSRGKIEKLMQEINTTDAALNGIINDNIILLKAI